MKNIGYQNNSKPFNIYCPACRMRVSFEKCRNLQCWSFYRCLELARSGILEMTSGDQVDTENKENSNLAPEYIPEYI